jgi:hypothetical protein
VRGNHTGAVLKDQLPFAVQKDKRNEYRGMNHLVGFELDTRIKDILLLTRVFIKPLTKIFG